MPCTDMVVVFFFNDTATTEIYTLSLHDALPISNRGEPETLEYLAWRYRRSADSPEPQVFWLLSPDRQRVDRKSTRLNSSHSQISYAVFCLKKKTNSNT